MRYGRTLKMLSKLEQSSNAWQRIEASFMSISNIFCLNFSKSPIKEGSSGSRTSYDFPENTEKHCWNSPKITVTLALRFLPLIPPISTFSNLLNSRTVLKNHCIVCNLSKNALKRTKTISGWKFHNAGSRSLKNLPRLFLYVLNIVENRFNVLMQTPTCCIASSISLWNNVDGSRHFFAYNRSVYFTHHGIKKKFVLNKRFTM